MFEEQALLYEQGQATGFYLRANLEIPVLDRGDPLAFTTWVSISETNFERAGMLWDQPDRVDEPPYFAWFTAAIPTYPPAVHLKAHVHTRAPGLRPTLELEQTAHPLAVDQLQGVPEAKVGEIAAASHHSTT